MNSSLGRWTVRAIAVAITLIVVGGAVYWGFFGSGPPGEADEEEVKGTATVTTVEVTQGSLAPTATAYGTVTSSPEHTFVISLMRDGIFKTVNVRDGDSVRSGQPLFTVTTASANTATYLQAKSAVEFASSDLARLERLLANKLATNDQVATARKALADAQLQLDQQIKIGAGAAEEVVRAPFDGVITGLMATPGDKVQANTTIATVSSRANMVVQLGVEPNVASKLAAGAAVRITVPFDGSKELAGKLTSVSGTVDPMTHLVKAFANIPEVAGANLALGTTIVGHIDLPPQQGLLVPRTALLEDASGPYIFTVSEGEAKKQNIKVLVESDDMALIDGFDPALGTRVVVTGNTELDDDTPVEEAKS